MRAAKLRHAPTEIARCTGPADDSPDGVGPPSGSGAGQSRRRQRGVITGWMPHHVVQMNRIGRQASSTAESSGGRVVSTGSPSTAKTVVQQAGANTCGDRIGRSRVERSCVAGGGRGRVFGATAGGHWPLHSMGHRRARWPVVPGRIRPRDDESGPSVMVGHPRPGGFRRNAPMASSPAGCPKARPDLPRGRRCRAPAGRHGSGASRAPRAGT